jgi:predicted TIM-barrel fold metal-dependent hydrolase
MPIPLDLLDVFRAALRVFGPERVLFGTDSTFLPRGWRRDIFEAQIKLLAVLGVAAEDVRKILGGNLKRIVGT